MTTLFIHLELIRAERKSTTSSSSLQVLPMEYISQCLRLLFPYKPDDAFESLCSSLAQCFQESPKSLTDYSLLFRDPRSGGLAESSFLEEVRDQHLYEIENFMIQLTEEIVLLARPDEDAPEDDGIVRIYDVHNAWIRLDPHATVETMDKYISRALRLPVGANGTYSPVDPMTIVRPNEFCRSLFATNLIKHTCNFDANACSKISTVALEQPVTGAATQTSGPAPDEKKGKSARRSTSGDPPEAQPAPAPPSGGKPPAADSLKPKLPKDTTTSASHLKFVRLRSRFGLDGRDARPDEILLLERGPNFHDSTNSSLSRELETLMSEKAMLEETRNSEKVKLREQAERSAQAIQGIGVIKRRETITANSGTDNDKTEEKTATTDAVNDDNSPADTAATTSDISPPPVVPTDPPILAPVAASTATETPVSPIVPPRYRSSFLVAPEIHAATASHQSLPMQTPPGSAIRSPNAAFQRRYAGKRRSQDAASVTMQAIAAAAAAVASTSPKRPLPKKHAAGPSSSPPLSARRPSPPTTSRANTNNRNAARDKEPTETKQDNAATQPDSVVYLDPATLQI